MVEAEGEQKEEEEEEEVVVGEELLLASLPSSFFGFWGSLATIQWAKMRAFRSKKLGKIEGGRE
jgi:hypothetical protein